MKSQVIGNWNSSATSTYTVNAVGIGTNTPGSWQETEYCLNTQRGLIVTKQNCAGNEMNGIIGFSGGHLADNMNILPILSGGTEGYLKHIPISFFYSTVLSNPSLPYSIGIPVTSLYSTQQPLIWAKVKETQLGGSPISTKFIVTPDGRVGINLPSPRAPLDVRGSYDVNVPLAIFGINTTNNFSRHIHISANLGNGGYNNLSQTGDVGLFFTDGQNALNNGSNLNGALVIAPWNTGNGIGGMRMEANGNVQLRGNLRCKEITVNQQWWPDFVFAKDYSLPKIESIDSFIKINNHLPGMPSQDSIASNGQNIAEIQRLQQLKLEELTLYIIELNKLIAFQLAEIESLKLSIAKKENE